jgi:hypothetical protein
MGMLDVGGCKETCALFGVFMAVEIDSAVLILKMEAMGSSEASTPHTPQSEGKEYLFQSS